MSSKLEEELDYLVKESGKQINILLAEALEEGLHMLYKRHVKESYVSGRIERKRAIQLLGTKTIEKIDKAWEAVEKDVRWGFDSE